MRDPTLAFKSIHVALTLATFLLFALRDRVRAAADASRLMTADQLMPEAQRSFLNRWITAAVILTAVFAFRFLSFTGFLNDHFVYVARAQQMLLGAWPVRDFVDPGFLLMYVASATALVSFGHNLIGEALLVFGGFAAAAALSYPLARAAAGSAAIAAVAVALQALAYPRSYSYPKFLLHALAIMLCWGYLARPTSTRRIGLAGFVAIAFLFRPDHGAVIGLAALCAVAWADARPGPARAKSVLGFSAVTAVFLLPWVVFVQSTVGLVAHLRSVREFSGRKVDMGRMGWPAFPIDVSWGPGLLAELDHQAFLYYLFLLLPVIGAAQQHRRSDAAAPMPHAAGRLWVVTILAVCVNLTLLRGLNNRLADVAVPQAILAAWLFPAAWRAARGFRLTNRIVLRSTAMAIAYLLVLSVVRLGSTRERFGHIPILRPDAVIERAVTVAWALRDIDRSAGEPRTNPVTLGPFVAYLQKCTRPDDRVMYAGYAPETYFFARRGFAGGQVVVEGGYYSSLEEQRRTLSRLQRERVPVIALPDEFASDFRDTFGWLADYIDAYYVRAGSIELPGRRQGDVFVDRRRAHADVYEPLGWPCFAA